MKVVLKISHEQFNWIRDYWIEENLRYYGTPIGFKRLAHSDPLLQLPCGHSVIQDVCGVDVHRWVTSGGNVAHIWCGNGQPLWVYSGKRHAVNGVCQPIDLSENEVVLHETTRPDVSWWDVCSGKGEK